MTCLGSQVACTKLGSWGIIIGTGCDTVPGAYVTSTTLLRYTVPLGLHKPLWENAGWVARNGVFEGRGMPSTLPRERRPICCAGHLSRIGMEGLLDLAPSTIRYKGSLK